MLATGMRWAPAPVFFALLLAACGGNSEPAAPPAKGAEVCDRLDQTERFRYTFTYTIDTPRQESPPDDSEKGDYAIPPSQPDFLFTTTHNGAFMQPDRLDFEISTTPDQPTTRTIRIGNGQWFLLGDTWQLASQETSFPHTPLNVCDALVSFVELEGQVGSPESVGDTKARHFRIEDAPMSAAAQLFGPASDMGRLLQTYDVDLWLSEKDNRLVKVVATSSATYPYGRALSITLSLEVGSFNDKTIKIEAPI